MKKTLWVYKMCTEQVTGCIYVFLASFWCYLHSTQILWFFQWHKCFLKDFFILCYLEGFHNKLTACPSCNGLLKTFVPSQCCHHNIWRAYVFVSYFTSSRCVKTFCSQLEELLCCCSLVVVSVHGRYSNI